MSLIAEMPLLYWVKCSREMFHTKKKQKTKKESKKEKWQKEGEGKREGRGKKKTAYFTLF